MPHSVSIPLLLSILQEPDGDKARERYLHVLERADFDDQLIYDTFEDLVCNAVMLNETEIEVDTELAKAILLILKCGIHRQRGGQQIPRHRERQRRTLIGLARKRKDELVADGMSAIQARLAAAEEVAAAATERGLDYSSSYIARQMDKKTQAQSR